MESSRRKATREHLRLNTENMLSELTAVNAEEFNRRSLKQRRLEKLEKQPSYRFVKWLAKVMDKYFLDPILSILGIFFPGAMTIVQLVLTLPYLFVAIFKIRSVALTMAIIFNTLLDILLGLIPFVGTVLDFFHLSYAKNYRLIVGFAEDDAKVMAETRRKAWFLAIGSVLYVGIIIAWYTLIASLISGAIFGLYKLFTIGQ